MFEGRRKFGRGLCNGYQEKGKGKREEGRRIKEEGRDCLRWHWNDLTALATEDTEE
jgi:hypothetical protein